MGFKCVHCASPQTAFPCRECKKTGMPAEASWQSVRCPWASVCALERSWWKLPRFHTFFVSTVWVIWTDVHYILVWSDVRRWKVSLSSIHYLKCPFAKVKKQICLPHPKHSQTKKSMQKNQVQCGFCLHVPLILQRYWFQLQFSQLLGTFGVRSRCEWYRAGQRLWFGECFGKAVGMFAFGLHPFLGWKKQRESLSFFWKLSIGRNGKIWNFDVGIGCAVCAVK